MAIPNLDDPALSGTQDSSGIWQRLTGAADEAGEVVDPTQGADPTTETYLRVNPITAGPTFLSDTADALTGGERDATSVESTLFERPGELPWIEPGSDTADLPLGSPRDPLNLDGGPAGPTGGAGAGQDTPEREALLNIPWGRILGGLAVVGVLLVAVNAFAGGLAEGLAG
jgi:hypothetical protein